MLQVRCRRFASACRVVALFFVGLAMSATNSIASSQGFIDCVPVVASVTGDSLYSLPYGTRLVQPLAQPSNVAACSLGVRYPSYSWPTLEVVAWDPQSLAPDPTTVALRTRRFDPSSMQFAKLTQTFSPPIVMRSLDAVADGRTQAPALMLAHRNTFTLSNPLFLHQQVAADPGIPAALASIGVQPFAPLAGPHAALAQALCGGSQTIADYRVAQCVMTTDQALAPSWDHLAQHFRVAQPVVLQWAEIANALNPAAGGPWPVEVTIHEGSASSPPLDLSSELARAVTTEIIEADVYHQDHSRWLPTLDFDAQVTLLPGRDYWLVVREAIQWSMFTRVRTGDESPEFDAAIGSLMRRANDAAPWTEVPSRSLSFRLIGTLSSVIDAPVPATGQGGFSLRARPSPARGPVLISWSGADSRVRIDVLDIGGRVLGCVLDRAGPSGSRSWDGEMTNGRRLGGGVYLLRARSGSAAPVTQRVVLIR